MMMVVAVIVAPEVVAVQSRTFVGTKRFKMCAFPVILNLSAYAFFSFSVYLCIYSMSVCLTLPSYLSRVLYIPASHSASPSLCPSIVIVNS